MIRVTNQKTRPANAGQFPPRCRVQRQMEIAMAKKKTPDELYWEMMAKKQIRDEYNQFLQEQGQEGSPHLADIFEERGVCP